MNKFLVGVVCVMVLICILCILNYIDISLVLLAGITGIMAVKISSKVMCEKCSLGRSLSGGLENTVYTNKLSNNQSYISGGGYKDIKLWPDIASHEINTSHNISDSIIKFLLDKPKIDISHLDNYAEEGILSRTLDLSRKKSYQKNLSFKRMLHWGQLKL